MKNSAPKGRFEIPEGEGIKAMVRPDRTLFFPFALLSLAKTVVVKVPRIVQPGQPFHFITQLLQRN